MSSRIVDRHRLVLFSHKVLPTGVSVRLEEIPLGEAKCQCLNRSIPPMYKRKGKNLTSTSGSSRNARSRGWGMPLPNEAMAKSFPNQPTCPC